MNAPPAPVAAALHSLLRHCHRRRYPKGGTVFLPGDPGDTLYYLTEGSVSVTMEDASARDLVLGYLYRGDFIGEMCVFMGPVPRRVRVQTREASVLAEIGYAKLDVLLQQELAGEAVSILKLLARRIAAKLMDLREGKLRGLVFDDASQRVWDCLRQLCREPDALTHPEGMQIHISRQEIGRLVGCSRELAGQILKRLAQQGLLQARGKTIVVYRVPGESHIGPRP